VILPVRHSAPEGKPANVALANAPLAAPGEPPKGETAHKSHKTVLKYPFKIV
jgi:hypothetical protein